LKREFKESDLQFGVVVVASVVAVARFIIPSQVALSTSFITHSIFFSIFLPAFIFSKCTLAPLEGKASLRK